MLVPNISHMSHHIEEPIDYNFAHIRRLQLDVLELACPDHSNSLARRHWPCPEASGGLCADSCLHCDLIERKKTLRIARGNREPLLQSQPLPYLGNAQSTPHRPLPHPSHDCDCHATCALLIWRPRTLGMKLGPRSSQLVAQARRGASLAASLHPSVS